MSRRRAQLRLPALARLRVERGRVDREAGRSWAAPQIRAVTAAGLMGTDVASFRAADPLTAQALENLVFDLKARLAPPVDASRSLGADDAGRDRRRPAPTGPDDHRDDGTTTTTTTATTTVTTDDAPALGPKQVAEPGPRR